MAKNTPATQTQAKNSRPSTNVDALKSIWKRISEESNKSSGGPDGESRWLPWLKIEVGKVVHVRFLPLAFNNNIPFITVKEHRGLFPNSPYRATCCPQSVGEGKCPICEYAFSNYMEAKDAEDNNKMAAMKPLMPKKRVYAAIWNRSTKQIEKIGMSWKLFNEVMAEWGDGEDVTDVNTGFDFKIKGTKTEQGTSYTASKSDLSKPLADDEDEISSILEKLEAHQAEIIGFKSPLSADELKGLLKVEADATGSDDDEAAAENDDDADVDALLARAKKNNK